MEKGVGRPGPMQRMGRACQGMMITLSVVEFFSIVFYALASIVLLYMLFTLLRDNILKYYSSKPVDKKENEKH